MKPNNVAHISLVCIALYEKVLKTSFKSQNCRYLSYVYLVDKLCIYFRKLHVFMFYNLQQKCRALLSTTTVITNFKSLKSCITICPHCWYSKIN